MRSAKAGKAELAQACHQRAWAQAPTAPAMSSSIRRTLSPEQFAAVAQGAENRRMSGMLPENLMSNIAVSDALATAAKSCFTRQAASR